MEARIQITLILDPTDFDTSYLQTPSRSHIADIVQRCLAAQIRGLPEKLALVRGVAIDDWTYSVTVDTTGGF